MAPHGHPYSDHHDRVLHAHSIQHDYRIFMGINNIGFILTRSC